MKPVIVGAGLAGLTVALSLAPMPVILLSSKKLGLESSSAWAQGGIAASIGLDDNAKLHAEDTVKAGAGLCDAAIVEQVTLDSARVIEELLKKGVQFDRRSDGQFELGLEGAHSRRRIIHAEGDSTGAAVMKALITAVRNTPSIEVIEDAVAIELLGNPDIRGVIIKSGDQISQLLTDRVVLATGGAGALWRHTTNPLGSWGRGLLLAARQGALLSDLEFMQFHPTAIDCGRDPMPLASEALRGEGAILIDETGDRFMEHQGRAELEPRDVVARAIWGHMEKGHKVFLDTRATIGAALPSKFPAIYQFCLAAGFDPIKTPIPVRPAAHYHMGGIVTDARGRTNIDGLWACGEVASTGLHGANRLASNSLLEAASFGRKVAEDLSSFETKPTLLTVKNIQNRAGVSETVPLSVRSIMTENLGVIRDPERLQTALDQLALLAGEEGASDATLIALMIALSASKRLETRGAHARSDYPSPAMTSGTRQTITLNAVLPYLNGTRLRAVGA